MTRSSDSCKQKLDAGILPFIFVFIKKKKSQGGERVDGGPSFYASGRPLYIYM